MHERPLVSILMTAYNRELYIAEAIQSVIASIYDNWELIITDDCSSDATYKIAKEYASLDNRIRVYKNEINLGDYPNRNKAASFANGEFLMSVDSDDLLLPETMYKCLTLFEQNTFASFGIFSPHHYTAQCLNPEQIIRHHFFDKPLLLLGPGGSIIRNSYFKAIGGFPTKYGPANDGYYNLKAASQTNTLIMPFEYIYYRRHDGQEINNKYAYLTNNYLYLKDALKELELPISNSEKEFLMKKNKRRFFTNLFRFYVRTKEWGRTKAALKSTKFGLKDSLIAIFQ